jgi:hypothetical protein
VPLRDANLTSLGRPLGGLALVLSHCGKGSVTPPPLTGIVLKLDRAEDHLDALNESIQRFTKKGFCTARQEFDRDRRLTLRVNQVFEPPPGWGVLIGEIVYNLRSALDHMVYELAVVNHGTRAPPRDIAESSAFPIFANGLKFRWGNAKKASKSGKLSRDSGRHKIRAVSRPPRAAIDRLQPYHRRKNPASRALLQLEELSNMDKHRTLHFTILQQVESRYRIVGRDVRRIRSIQAVPPIQTGRNTRPSRC